MGTEVESSFGNIGIWPDDTRADQSVMLPFYLIGHIDSCNIDKEVVVLHAILGICFHALDTQAISNVDSMHFSHVNKERYFDMGPVHVPHDVDCSCQLVEIVEAIIASLRFAESIQNVFETGNFQVCRIEKRSVDRIFEIRVKVTANVL
jgi:hypothetical protein